MAPTGDRSGSPFLIVLVAIAGLLSTLGAAGLSGYLTNASVERQFEQQRTAQIQDLRRQVYVDFLRGITETCIAGGTGDDAKINKAVTQLLSEAGRAELIATPAVQESVREFANSVVHVFVPSIPSKVKDGCDDESLLASRTSFLRVAEEELLNS
jgi:hypothetical protein